MTLKRDKNSQEECDSTLHMLGFFKSSIYLLQFSHDIRTTG